MKLKIKRTNHIFYRYWVRWQDFENIKASKEISYFGEKSSPFHQKKVIKLLNCFDYKQVLFWKNNRVFLFYLCKNHSKLKFAVRSANGKYVETHLIRQIRNSKNKSKNQTQNNTPISSPRKGKAKGKMKSPRKDNTNKNTDKISSTMENIASIPTVKPQSQLHYYLKNFEIFKNEVYFGYERKLKPLPRSLTNKNVAQIDKNIVAKAKKRNIQLRGKEGATKRHSYSNSSSSSSTSSSGKINLKVNGGKITPKGKTKTKSKANDKHNKLKSVNVLPSMKTIKKVDTGRVKTAIKPKLQATAKTQIKTKKKGGNLDFEIFLFEFMYPIAHSNALSQRPICLFNINTFFDSKYWNKMKKYRLFIDISPQSIHILKQCVRKNHPSFMCIIKNTKSNKSNKSTTTTITTTKNKENTIARIPHPTKHWKCGQVLIDTNLKSKSSSKNNSNSNSNNGSIKNSLSRPNSSAGSPTNSGADRSKQFKSILKHWKGQMRVRINITKEFDNTCKKFKLNSKEKQSIIDLNCNWKGKNCNLNNMNDSFIYCKSQKQIYFDYWVHLDDNEQVASFTSHSSQFEQDLVFKTPDIHQISSSFMYGI